SSPIYHGTIVSEPPFGTFSLGEPITTTGGVHAVLDTLPSYVTGGPFRNDETITGDLGGEVTAASDAVMLAAGISFPDEYNMTTADLIYPFVYKQRLFFVQRESMNVWYLPVDQIGGELTLLPLAGVFEKGGQIVFGTTWSND